MGFLNTLDGELKYGAGKALGAATGELNKVGIATPQLGLSNRLTNVGASELNSGGNNFSANVPFGLNPTQSQQQQIVQNPFLSSPQYAGDPNQPGGAGVTQTPASQNTGNTLSSTGSSSSNSSYYLPPVTYLGKVYDQSDPAQAQALLQAKQQTLGGQRDQAVSQINRQLGENLNQAGQTNAFNLANLNQNATDYGRSLANNVVNLGQGYDLGQVNSQQQFAGLSPNAFQSAQGTSQQYGTDQYNKGLTQLHQNAAETVGDGYLANGQIDPNSTIGRQIAGLNSQYNQFTNDAQNSAQLGIQSANNAYGTGLDQNASNLQALYNYGGVPQFNYNSQGYDPNALPSVNIGQYTPYTNASQLAQSPQAQQPSPATYTGSNNPFAGLLGYNPTSSQSNYLNAFTGAGSPSTAS